MPTLSRRTVLKGMGATLALPVLDAMVPKAAWAAPEQLVKNRSAFVFFPNGVIMDDWYPKQTGANFDLPKSLKSLKDHQQDLLVISGLAHDKARANGDGAGDHARSSAAFLTGSQPRKTDGADIHLGKSIDQLMAEQVGQDSRLPSLELGIEAGRQAGRCDSGYSCAYQSNISWKSPTTPTGKEVNPRAVFERMFGTGEDDKARRQREFYRKSVLDFVTTDADKLKKQLGTNDRRKLDEYFTSVREIEQRIERSAAESQQAMPDMEIPAGIPKDWAEHVRLMFDLMVVAFQTDTTRICTFMLANEGSNRRYKEVGVNEGHHQLSHHKNDKEKMALIQKIDEYLVQQFAWFLDRLKSIQEGDGTLLDHSMIVYGCAISDGNRHWHHDLPIILAGRGNGTIDPGRHVKYDSETPMNNLFLAMLDRMGGTEDRFGDSTGRVSGLTV
jgi:hypothetical protein